MDKAKVPSNVTKCVQDMLKTRIQGKRRHTSLYVLEDHWDELGDRCDGDRNRVVECLISIYLEELRQQD